MKLKQLTDRVWYFPFEEERDRPNLGYIRGDRWSLAVDAGHSGAHVQAFYEALSEAGLPLPALTVLTHWHWDHSFALHAVHGLSLAGEKTNRHLLAFREEIARNGPEVFFSLHESVRKEYAGGQPVVVRPADMTYTGEMRLDLGNCPVRIFETEAPHTDDSTLIEATAEKVLFLGDADCGVFPTWEKDPALSRSLARVIAGEDVRYCLDGHWTAVTKEEEIAEILSAEG